MDASGQRSVVLCVEAPGAAPSFASQCLNASAYRLVGATNAIDAARELRHRVFDACLIEGAGDRSAAFRLCRLIRRCDPHAPVFVYAPSPTGMACEADRAGVTRLLDTEALSLSQAAAIIGRCIAEAELRNVAAISAEIVAAHEHLAERGEALAERARVVAQATSHQRDRAMAAQRRYAETMALRRYLAAGGTRAGFSRAWLSLHLGHPASGLH